MQVTLSRILIVKGFAFATKTAKCRYKLVQEHPVIQFRQLCLFINDAFDLRVSHGLCGRKMAGPKKSHSDLATVNSVYNTSLV